MLERRLSKCSSRGPSTHMVALNPQHLLFQEIPHLSLASVDRPKRSTGRTSTQKKTANQRQLDGNTFSSKSSMAPTAFALLQPVSPSMGEIPTGAPAPHPIVTATSCGSWNLPSLLLPWSLYPFRIPLNGEPLPESKLQQKCHPHTDNFSDGSVETAVPRPQK